MDSAPDPVSVEQHVTWRLWLADRWLLPALLLALAVRLLVGWLVPHNALLGDEREYFSAAAILADGRGFSYFDQSLWLRPPLYIVGLATLFRLGGLHLLPVYAVQVVLSVATVLLVYLLAWLWYQRRGVARAAALLCALYLPFAVYSWLLLSETVFTFLLVLAFVALAVQTRRGGWWPLVVAGLALGGAILTRGVALPFLAAIPLWAWASRERAAPPAWGLLLRRSTLVIGIALLCIAPWTARNALAYHRLIPVDTTGGYNFWLGALQGQNVGQIDATLREVTNPADRQAVAWARGWAVVQAVPDRFLLKALREAGDLWRINFASFERLTRGYGLGAVPWWWLLLTCFLDDVLYLVSLPLAVLGWRGTGRRADRWLLALWILWNCLTSALFFAIGRFRLPLLPFVFILAAHGGSRLPAVWRDLSRQRWRPWLVPLVGAALVLVLTLPTFLPGDYLLGIARTASASRLRAGYALLAQGQPAAAAQQFNALPTDYSFRPTALAATYHASGQDARALATLNDDLDSLGATLLRGAIYRDQGQDDAARQQFNYRDVRIVNPTGMAWEQLNPTPQTRLDVGNGLDLGYLRGVNLDERDGPTTYRWTAGRSEFRLAPVAGNGTVQLRLRGYRPVGTPPPVQVYADGQLLGTVTPTTDWAVYSLPLPASSGSARWLDLQLETPIFVLSYLDQRELGVMVDWIEVK